MGVHQAAFAAGKNHPKLSVTENQNTHPWLVLREGSGPDQLPWSPHPRAQVEGASSVRACGPHGTGRLSPGGTRSNHTGIL